MKGPCIFHSEEFCSEEGTQSQLPRKLSKGSTLHPTVVESRLTKESEDPSISANGLAEHPCYPAARGTLICVLAQPRLPLKFNSISLNFIPSA